MKPDLVAPGGHMPASMPPQSYLANIDPTSMRSKDQLFVMSGTSQAAAVTSGVVALMLQAQPTLTPDMVKCRLLDSARTAATPQGTRAYSLFQQGAGLIDAQAAVASTAGHCANVGLDISADIAGSAHFGGPANSDGNGNFHLMDMDAGAWSSQLWGDGYTWSRGASWSDSATWSQDYT